MSTPHPFEQLSKLRKKSCFTAAQARRAGVHPRLLSYYVNTAQLERIGWGVYRDPKTDSNIDFQWEDLVYMALSVPNSAICLISALAYFDMTDEIPREHWIALPHNQTAPSRPDARFVRTRNFDLGLTLVKFGKASVRIFDRERTVVDSFRLLSKEVAIKALRRYLVPTQRHEPDIAKITTYAKMLRVPIQPYLLALTA